MKMPFLFSVGAAFGALTASAALASSTVTTEFGRPCTVETAVSAAACSDVASGTTAKSDGWRDVIARKCAHDRVVEASRNTALANKRVDGRALVLASSGAAPATGWALTN